MPAKTSTSALTLDQTKLAQLIGQAWTEAGSIERRFPRVFALALARAMGLNGDKREAFVNLIALEVQSIEHQRRRDGFGTV